MVARRLNIPSTWIVYIGRIRDRTHDTTYLPKTVLGIFPFVIHSISYLAQQVLRLSAPSAPSLPSSSATTCTLAQKWSTSPL